MSLSNYEKVPLTRALALIVASMLGSSLFFAAWKWAHAEGHAGDALHWIVQTSPQKQALSTAMLAEMLDLSSDHPTPARTFSTKMGEQRLRAFPFIESARLCWLKPNSLYIDYTLRRPIAFVDDFENVAMDAQGFLFPYAPFFPLKPLPRLYFGLAPFGEKAADKPAAQWHQPMAGKHFDCARALLALIELPAIKGALPNPCIDVSNVRARSAATREIVLKLEDVDVREVGGKQVRVRYPRLLRLSTHNYAQELGNYLKLREQLRLAEAQQRGEREEQGRVTVIDLRISDVGFVTHYRSLAK